jgi:HTH-type transcriptional regulator / antitoxin HipB
MPAIRNIHDLAATIRGRRLERGWTQAELADRAGVSRSWLIALEAGRPKAGIGLILQVLDALDVALDVADTTDVEHGESVPPIDLDTHLDRYRP